MAFHLNVFTGQFDEVGGGGGGSPGGSTTQIQFNSAGSFGGVTGATTDGTNITLGKLIVTQPVSTSGNPNIGVITGGAHTTLAASTEAIDVNFNLARTVQFSTGAITTQRAVVIQAPTYGFVGASTITTASTFTITGAPITGTNATITNPYAFVIASGNMKIGDQTAGTPLAAIGQNGIEMVFSNNTSGGVGLESANTNAGTSAYVGTSLNNDLANGSTYTHFAGIYLQSSGYNDASFGTILNVPSAYQIYGTDGPTIIGTSNAASYINFFVGGGTTPALANEVGRWTTAGLTVGLSGTLSGLIKLPGSTSGTVSLSVAAAAGTWTMKLPITAGVAGQFMQTDGSGNTTWAQGGVTTWNDQTGASVTMAVNNGYIADRGSLVTLTLPTTAALGSVFAIAGYGAGGWKLAQAASQTIHFGNLDTTTGTGGSLASTNRYDSIEIVCVVANTDFTVRSSVGSHTIV